MQFSLSRLPWSVIATRAPSPPDLGRWPRPKPAIPPAQAIARRCFAKVGELADAPDLETVLDDPESCLVWPRFIHARGVESLTMSEIADGNVQERLLDPLAAPNPANRPSHNLEEHRR